SAFTSVDEGSRCTRGSQCSCSRESKASFVGEVQGPGLAVDVPVDLRQPLASFSILMRPPIPNSSPLALYPSTWLLLVKAYQQLRIQLAAWPSGGAGEKRERSGPSWVLGDTQSACEKQHQRPQAKDCEKRTHWD
ncbi:hypothetical protein P7K49_009135, partial [Saguinus oedipus]